MKKIFIFVFLLGLVFMLQAIELDGKWRFEYRAFEGGFHMVYDFWLRDGSVYVDEDYIRIIGFYEVLHGSHSDYLVLSFWMTDHRYFADLNEGVDGFISGFGRQIFWKIEKGKSANRPIEVPMLFWMTKEGEGK